MTALYGASVQDIGQRIEKRDAAFSFRAGDPRLFA
jgi:hypothetical protein